MNVSRRNRSFATTVIAVLIASSLFAGIANADMVSTREAMGQYDRAALSNLLQTEQAQQQLLAMGVDPDRVAERVASLTNAELAHFNQQLEEGPAGSSVAGVILTLFIVFVITDMLCATDLFNFVKCIN